MLNVLAIRYKMNHRLYLISISWSFLRIRHASYQHWPEVVKPIPESYKIAIMRRISLAQPSFLHHICGSHESYQKLASPVLAWTELPAKEQRLKQQLLKLKLFNRFNDL